MKKKNWAGLILLLAGFVVFLINQLSNDTRGELILISLGACLFGILILLTNLKKPKTKDKQ